MAANGGGGRYAYIIYNTYTYSGEFRVTTNRGFKNVVVPKIRPRAYIRPDESLTNLTVTRTVYLTITT